MDTLTKLCKNPDCGALFTPRTNAHKYCTPDCRGHVREAQKPRLAPRTCLHCEAPYTLKGAPGSLTRYCSPGCRDDYRKGYQRARNQILMASYAPRCQVGFPTCELCGEIFAARTRRPDVKTCRKPDCIRRRKNIQQAAWFRKYREEHGVTYQHDRYSDKREVYKLRRLEKLAEGWEHINHLEVFERDRWVCRICFTPVDPALKWPDPGSKPMDHIIPVANGGTHTLDNVQLAHLGCNCAKSNAELDPELSELAELLSDII